MSSFVLLKLDWFGFPSNIFHRALPCSTTSLTFKRGYRQYYFDKQILLTELYTECAQDMFPKWFFQWTASISLLFYERNFIGSDTKTWVSCTCHTLQPIRVFSKIFGCAVLFSLIKENNTKISSKPFNLTKRFNASRKLEKNNISKHDHWSNVQNKILKMIVFWYAFSNGSSL